MGTKLVLEYSSRLPLGGSQHRSSPSCIQPIRSYPIALIKKYAPYSTASKFTIKVTPNQSHASSLTPSRRRPESHASELPPTTQETLHRASQNYRRPSLEKARVKKKDVTASNCTVGAVPYSTGTVITLLLHTPHSHVLWV